MVFLRISFFMANYFGSFCVNVWYKINFWRLNLGACFWSSCHTFHWNFTTLLLLWSLKGFNYMKSFICPQNKFRSLSMVQRSWVFSPLSICFELCCHWIRCSAVFSESWHFLVYQCFLVASSLLLRRNLIYQKSSDLLYVITLIRERWPWLGYITGSSKWLSLCGSTHRQVESWTCTLNFRFILFVKHLSMKAINICTGFFFPSVHL